MKKLTIVAFFAALFANTVFAAEVNVFSARHYDSDIQLYEKFTAKTGIKVNVVSGKDKALQKRITEEGADSKADIGIFMRRPKQLNYIQKKLIDIKYYIYGSNKYLEKFGMPKTITDLNKHNFISFGKGAPSPVYNPDWALKLGMHDGKKRKTMMKVNSVMGLLLAVESGVGLAALPEYLVSNSSNVIKVLPKSEGPITEAHFVYPQSLKNTARVQAFRNFLFSKIGDWK